MSFLRGNQESCQATADTAQLATLCAVDGGERAIMYDRIQGVLEKPVGEGTHIRIPWFQTPHVMDIRTRPRSVSSVTGTKGESISSTVPGEIVAPSRTPEFTITDVMMQSS